MRRTVWIASVATVCMLTSTRVSATDCETPAVLAQFADAPCIEVVDRSLDPIVHIEYNFDDFELGSTDPDTSELPAGTYLGQAYT